MADAVIDTNTINRRDREAYWHHVLGDTFAPVHVERWAEASDPSAKMSSTIRGRLMFVELAATAHIHRRTSRLIRKSDAGFFQLAIVTKGVGTLEQEGRTATLAQGDLVIYENSRPFVWTFNQPWGAAALCIPGDAVRLTESERRDMSARRLSGRAGLSGVVARFVRDLTQHASHLPASQSERVLAQASDLAISLLGSSANPEYVDARARTTLTRIKGYIDLHLRNPDLTPDQIASTANISTRYLHKLFEGEHQTVALYLRAQRLQRVRDDLLDPRHSHRGIAAIAHAFGFSDLSGFNRSFKAAYGVTPSEMRRDRSRNA